MKTDVLGIFSSHYSLGRSCLTLEDAKTINDYPVSVFSLLKHHNIDTLVLCDSSVSGFLQANQQCIKHNVKLVYGLKVTVCADMEDKSEQSLKTEAKYIIFIKNNNGYKNHLIRLSSECNKRGFYYKGRLDFKTLKNHWNDKNLKLAVPFYDSFLHLNTLESHLHVPDFFVKPTFFVEDNDLPFDYLVKNRVDEYCAANNYETVRAQTVLYPKREDFISYLTIRAINSRSSLEKPNLDHMGSDSFSFERFMELNK